MDENMNEQPNRKTIFVLRILIGIGFFILGLSFSSTVFFSEYPLFGINYMAELFISTVAGLLGFFLVPTYFVVVKDWVEEIMAKTISRLVRDFWNQYMRQMEEDRNSRKRANKKKNKLKEKISGGILIDTSMLIDGRLVGIAKTGFVLVPLVIPRSVLDELHLLSDNEDDIKRQKGRRGLDMINKLKKVCKVEILKQKGSEGVDSDLLILAKEFNLRIMTLDFNLNKVANVENVKVLNLNDLVEAVKPDFVPGERFDIRVVQFGKEEGQGVGYLPDGTMVVVDDADNKVNKTVTVVVSKLIQTSAGKMIFGKLVK